MKCPKCGSECEKRDAGLLRSIPFDFCPKCREEPLAKKDDTIFLDEFEEILDELSPIPTWGYFSSTPPAWVDEDLNTSYSQEIYNNPNPYAVTIEIYNSSFDIIDVICNGQPYDVKAGDKCTFSVSSGENIRIVPSSPPQSIKWRKV